MIPPRKSLALLGGGTVLAIAAFCLASPSGASQPYSPTLELVSISNSAPGANANVTLRSSLPAGHHLLGLYGLEVPGWTIAGDGGVPNGQVTVVGTMAVNFEPDGNCNDGDSGTPQSYPFVLRDEDAGGSQGPHAQWGGIITDFADGDANSTWLLTFTVEPRNGGYTIDGIVTDVVLPAGSTVCTPQTLILTFCGRASATTCGSGTNPVVMTNPSSAACYNWLLVTTDESGQHSASPSAGVSIGGTPCPTPTATPPPTPSPSPTPPPPADADGDGVIDETPCGSDPNDATKRPERIDPPFQGTDDDGDGQTDEVLPAGVQNYDCDGDGYKGSAENHVYAPNTRGDQDPCASNSSPPQSPAVPIGWPADLIGGSFSGDRINIQDLSSYVTSSPRRMNTSPGDPGYDVRWDVVPGSTFGEAINIQDLSSVNLVKPPMLDLRKAYGGPLCPWVAVDYDGDGVIDETPCGSNPTNASRRPERVDGTFAGVDDDGDTLVDEPLPANSGVYDCDGDGYRGSTEDHVFTPNLQGDQDACGTNAWPADFIGGSFSGNKVNVQDLSSFITPVRRMNTSPGDPGYNVRWDLVPGTTFGEVINIQDLSSVTKVVPPMLGVRAYGGPPCPWAP